MNNNGQRGFVYENQRGAREGGLEPSTSGESVGHPKAVSSELGTGSEHPTRSCTFGAGKNPRHGGQYTIGSFGCEKRPQTSAPAEVRLVDPTPRLEAEAVRRYDQTYSQRARRFSGSIHAAAIDAAQKNAMRLAAIAADERARNISDFDVAEETRLAGSGYTERLMAVG